MDPMQPEKRQIMGSLAARESEARALMRRLRACGRETERLAARSGAACGNPMADRIAERIYALRAEADHIRLELAGWDMVESQLWTENLRQRLDRLASAIADAGELDISRPQRNRAVVWRHPPKERHPIAVDVERVVYDYLYPQGGATAAF